MHILTQTQSEEVHFRNGAKVYYEKYNRENNSKQMHEQPKDPLVFIGGVTKLQIVILPHQQTGNLMSRALTSSVYQLTQIIRERKKERPWLQ